MKIGGWTTLHSMAKKGELTIHGELALKIYEDKNPTGTYGTTPLHIASEIGHFDMSKLFLELAVNKNPPNFVGLTPLHVAAGMGHSDICQLILDYVEDRTQLTRYKNIGMTEKGIY